jgi:hypothetical protein
VSSRFARKDIATVEVRCALGISFALGSERYPRGLDRSGVPAAQ